MTMHGGMTPWMEAGREAGLVLSAQQGDRGSYLELVEHYARPLYRLAYALTVHPDDAIELTRRTLIHGWENIAHLAVGRPFYPWLVRAGRNLSVVERRRRDGAMETLARGSQRERVFQAAFADLGPDERLLLAMRVNEKLPYADIAVTLEVSPRTAMTRIAQARERMRTRVAARAREAA
jgi:RNA polymerase sigma-70 factor, ECF subfamily